jgi:hypothetical protein
MKDLWKTKELLLTLVLNFKGGFMDKELNNKIYRLSYGNFVDKVELEVSHTYKNDTLTFSAPRNSFDAREIVLCILEQLEDLWIKN